MAHAIQTIKREITEILNEEVTARILKDRYSIEGDARTIEFWQQGMKVVRQAVEDSLIEFLTVEDEDYFEELSTYLSDHYEIGERVTITDETSPWFNYTGVIKGIGYESVTVSLRTDKCVWVMAIFKPSQLGEPHQHSIGDWVYVSDEHDRDFGRGGQIVKVFSLFDWVVDFNGFVRRDLYDEQLGNSNPSVNKEESCPYYLKQQYVIGKWHQITPKTIKVQSYLNNGKYALITWTKASETDAEPNITKVPIAQLERYEREFYLTA